MADVPHASGVVALLHNKLLTTLFALALIFGIVAEGVSIWRNVADTQLAQVNAKLADANTLVALLTAGKTDAETKLVAANTLVAKLTADKTKAETAFNEANTKLTAANTQVAILTQQKTAAETRLADANTANAQADLPTKQAQAIVAQDSAAVMDKYRTGGGRALTGDDGFAAWDCAHGYGGCPTQQPEQPAPTVATNGSAQEIVVTKELNVHIGANASTATCGKLVLNQPVEILESYQNGWKRIRGNCPQGVAGNGYVNGAPQFLQPVN